VTFDFSGRVAVVTGGTRGIGRAVVESFLASGADVITCGRHAPERPPEGARVAHFVQADVREPDQARALVHEAVERFGRLDVLVNNAGGSPYAPAAEASPRFVASVIGLNLLAPFYCAQAANASSTWAACRACAPRRGPRPTARPRPDWST
jgi:NAD(P)-dependent dehydrogenase (short-subunit alcohol dehydrogenase family)